MQSTTITDNDDIAKALSNIGKKSKDPVIKDIANKYAGAKKSVDKSKQGKKTATDNLTKDDIKDLLEDYCQVTDINTVNIGTHIRYFASINGENKFRRGGNLKLINKDEGYIILRNAVGNEWSVQLKGSTFFKKMTLTEIKKECDKITNELTAKNKKLKTKNDELTKKIKQLEEENEKLKKSIPQKRGRKPSK